SRLTQLDRYSDDVLFTFTLQINKRRLLAAQGLGSDSYHAVFLFFEQRLLALLAADVVTQDTELFAAPGLPTLIVVSGARFLFKGALLVVCNEDNAVQHAPSRPSVHVQDQLRRYRDLAQGPLNWGGFLLRRATPLHYRGVWHEQSPEDIRCCLSRSL